MLNLLVVSGECTNRKNGIYLLDYYSLGLGATPHGSPLLRGI